MKKIKELFLIGSILTLASCGEKKHVDTPGQVSPDIVNISATASGNEKENKEPKYEFSESNFDFGTISSGEVVMHEFKFKNTGDADLVISEAKGSCGCTEPEYPKSPIKPGETSIIKVTFNSSGMAGQLSKTITLLANTTPNTKVLTISAEVIKKEKLIILNKFSISLMINSILLQAAAPAGSGMSQQLLMIGMIVVVFYFFMIRPQMKKAKTEKSFKESLNKGDKVVTIGGVHGKIIDVQDKTFILEIDNNVKVKVEKTAISADVTKSYQQPVAEVKK